MINIIFYYEINYFFKFIYFHLNFFFFNITLLKNIVHPINTLDSILYKYRCRNKIANKSAFRLVSR